VRASERERERERERDGREREKGSPDLTFRSSLEEEAAAGLTVLP